MKALWGLVVGVLWLLNVAPGVTAQNANLLSTLSPCALDCLVETIPMVNCDLLDIACQCSRANLTALAANCMIANCTIAESLQLVEVDSIQCNRPHDSRHPLIVGFAIGSPFFMFIPLVLRIVSRFWTLGSLWWDDYFHIIGGAFGIPLTVFANLLAWHGFGYHLYDLKIKSVSRAEDLIFWFYLCQIWWALAILFVKLSILCLYLRIFPSRRFRVYVFIIMGCLILSVVILLPMAIWQCDPIPATWTLDFKDARCLSITKVAYANAGINIATEVAILVLPLPMLHTLQIQGTLRKIGLYALFGVGLLVIAIASVRIPTLGHLATINDPTYNNVPAYVWTCAEICVAHICAATPAIRSLVVRTYKEISTRAATYRLRRSDERFFSAKGGDFGTIFSRGLGSALSRRNGMRSQRRVVKSWVKGVPSFDGRDHQHSILMTHQIDVDVEKRGSPMPPLPPKFQRSDPTKTNILDPDNSSHPNVVGRANVLDLKSKFNENLVPTITTRPIDSPSALGGHDDDDDDNKSNLITVGLRASNLPSATRSTFSSSGTTTTTRPSAAASPIFGKDESVLLPPTPGSAITLTGGPLSTIQEVGSTLPGSSDSSSIPPLPVKSDTAAAFVDRSAPLPSPPTTATATAATTTPRPVTRLQQPFTYMDLSQMTLQRGLERYEEQRQRTPTPTRTYTPTPIATSGHRFEHETGGRILSPAHRHTRTLPTPFSPASTFSASTATSLGGSSSVFSERPLLSHQHRHHTSVSSAPSRREGEGRGQSMTTTTRSSNYSHNYSNSLPRLNTTTVTTTIPITTPAAATAAVPQRDSDSDPESERFSLTDYYNTEPSTSSSKAGGPVTGRSFLNM